MAVVASALPKIAAPVPARAPQAAAKPADDQSKVSVLSFRVLPGAGAPVVSAKTDSTLGKTGPIPWLLNKLESMGATGAKVAGGVRFFTRLVGPIMYGVSAYWNLRMLPSVMHDKTIKTSSKVILATGSGLVTVGAIGAAIAAMPVKLAEDIGLGMSNLVRANKISGISGGLAGLGFGLINMIETMRDKNASPSKRFFAKVGFGLGALSFVTGSAAMIMSMMGGGGLAIGLCSKIATFGGLLGLVANLGQAVLGKNGWLNSHLKGTFLG
ncbi:MAG TPA: hypothetical protein V6D47_03835 [Oscillatoriaceae cyanobacterium]